MTIYTISDTHFGHENIIKYCKRPFESVEEMDYEMIRRWNDTVSKNDEVYFVGDLTFGRLRDKDRARIAGLSRSQQLKARAEHYASKLNGRITWIKGNHIDPKNTVDCAKRKVGKYEFTFVHDPINAGDCGFWPSTRTWVVTGHHHNNQPVEFPFFDRPNHRFNVSVELINYTPVSLDRLIEIIESHEPRLACI